MSKNVLLTGFEPFAGADVNASEVVVRSLEGRVIAGRSVVIAILPVEASKIRAALERAIARAHADVVIATGQASGRNAVALERVAVNLLDFERSDNAGVTCKNEPVTRGGPDARLSPLPFDAIVQAWHADGIPGYVSNSAGSYICNQAFYELLGLAEATPMAAGFIHLPYLPSQAIAAGPASNPSMQLETMARALTLAVETIVPWLSGGFARKPVAKPKASSGVWIPHGV